MLILLVAVALYWSLSWLGDHLPSTSGTRTPTRTSAYANLSLLFLCGSAWAIVNLFTWGLYALEERFHLLVEVRDYPIAQRKEKRKIRPKD